MRSCAGSKEGSRNHSSGLEILRCIRRRKHAQKWSACIPFPFAGLAVLNLAGRLLRVELLPSQYLEFSCASNLLPRFCRRVSPDDEQTADDHRSEGGQTVGPDGDANAQHPQQPGMSFRVLKFHGHP